MSSSNSMPVPAAPLDDEDLLQETLLCLPPQPSSLPRTSLVCPRWHRILSYPKFLTRFRRQHKVPPLLGFLAKSWGMPTVFKPVDPPYHIPTERFSVPKPSKLYASWDLLGLAVLVNMWQHGQIIVWDPLSGQQHRVNFPPGLDNNEVAFWHASVMCADDQDGHVHGDCFSSPFKLVLIWVVRHNQASACLHESASAVWGETVMEITDQIYFISPGFLVGNALCWLLSGVGVLVFDLQNQNLCVVKNPTCITVSIGSVQLIQTKDSRLGLAYLSKQTIQLWERKPDYDGVVRWVLLQTTIQLEELFPQMFMDEESVRIKRYNDKSVEIKGHDDNTNVIVLSTIRGDFTLEVNMMEIKHIIKRNFKSSNTYYPYVNFYTAARYVRNMFSMMII
ncbi:hypothetical protein CFC21_081404 [Triticum aestivum]|uniref:F-box domain-containing protein n=2 Tax=Triticum aestivum TaxID=4565 RepID=A0A9R1I562_WHEAT|nr:hypothetical protein CFC21_081404 [Triticum aestivum]